MDTYGVSELTFVSAEVDIALRKFNIGNYLFVEKLLVAHLAVKA